MYTVRVRGWSDLFETAETRKLKNLRWVPVPTGHDTSGYRRCMRLADGTRIYGAWVLLLAMAASAPAGRRGDLVSRDGSPLTIDEMADRTGAPAEDFLDAIKALSNPRIGWLAIEDETGQPVPHPQIRWERLSENPPGLFDPAVAGAPADSAQISCENGELQQIEPGSAGVAGDSGEICGDPSSTCGDRRNEGNGREEKGTSHNSALAKTKKRARTKQPRPDEPYYSPKARAFVGIDPGLIAALGRCCPGLAVEAMIGEAAIYLRGSNEAIPAPGHDTILWLQHRLRQQAKEAQHGGTIARSVQRTGQAEGPAARRAPARAEIEL
jgi:hypothetical protein